MTVTDVSPGHQNPISTHLKCLEDEIGIDTSGTHHADNPHIGRILKTAHTRQISSRIGAPVAGKGDYSRSKSFSHELKLHYFFVITPATESIKIVISAKVPRQAQDRERAEWPESRWALDAGSSPA